MRRKCYGVTEYELVPTQKHCADSLDVEVVMMPSHKASTLRLKACAGLDSI